MEADYIIYRLPLRDLFSISEFDRLRRTRRTTKLLPVRDTSLKYRYFWVNAFRHVSPTESTLDVFGIWSIRCLQIRTHFRTLAASRVRVRLYTLKMFALCIARFPSRITIGPCCIDQQSNSEQNQLCKTHQIPQNYKNHHTPQYTFSTHWVRHMPSLPSLSDSTLYPHKFRISP